MSILRTSLLIAVAGAAIGFGLAASAEGFVNFEGGILTFWDNVRITKGGCLNPIYVSERECLAGGSSWSASGGFKLGGDPLLGEPLPPPGSVMLQAQDAYVNKVLAFCDSYTKLADPALCGTTLGTWSGNTLAKIDTIASLGTDLKLTSSGNIHLTAATGMPIAVTGSLAIHGAALRADGSSDAGTAGTVYAGTLATGSLTNDCSDCTLRFTSPLNITGAILMNNYLRYTPCGLPPTQYGSTDFLKCPPPSP